ncbi:MAG: VWA domain-containing protein, partial [Nitrospira sp.]|nr:VWA domain-containing protein [Nitrospira sp.]
MVKVGLEEYGHRKNGDCNDIEMMVPVGKEDKTSLIKRIQGLKPKGETPISKSLEIAGEQLKAVEQETTVVLVSDGKESCKGDPCAVIKALREQGIKVTLHVVGFGVTEEEKEQLTCIAEAGGGKYFTAQNANELKGALTEVKKEVVEKVETKVEPEEKEKKVVKLSKLAQGTISIPHLEDSVTVYEQQSGKDMGYLNRYSKTLKVPPGTYKLDFGNQVVENVVVEAGQEVVPKFARGTISIPHLEDSVTVYEQQSGKDMGYLNKFGKTLRVPPGTYKLDFGNQIVENVVVEAEQKVVPEFARGTISIPHLEDSVTVYEQQSGKDMG